MGIDEFSLSLLHPPTHIYRPGDPVAGNIRLISTPDEDLREGITVILYGFAFLEWTESQGRTSISYSGHDQLFKKSFLQPVTSEQIDYPFCFQIPAISALPWSATTIHGGVQYGVNAIIPRPWYKLGDKKEKVQIQVKSPVHQRLVPYSRNQYYYAHTIAKASEDVNAKCCCFPFCCWYFCGAKERVHVTFELHNLWAYPGEDVEFTLVVDNTDSKRQLDNAKIQLIGYWTHKGSMTGLLDEYATFKEIILDKVHAEEYCSVDVSPGATKLCKGKFKVPEKLMPSQVECDVLKLTYKLRASLAEISGVQCLGSEGSVEVDIVIGSPPLIDMEPSR